MAYSQSLAQQIRKILALRNRKASSTPNRSSYYIDEGAPLSWVYRLRYRRPKRIALLD